MAKILDVVKRKQIIAILAVGGTRTLAAQLVGCHPRTIYNVAQADPEFAQRLNEAETCPEYNMLDKLAACNQAHALKWGLERRYPDRFRPRPPGTFSVDAVKQLLAALAARLSDEAASDEERQRVLSTIRQVGKEAVIHTQPFIEDAVALMSDLGNLGEEPTGHPPTKQAPTSPEQTPPAAEAAADEICSVAVADEPQPAPPEVDPIASEEQSHAQ